MVVPAGYSIEEREIDLEHEVMRDSRGRRVDAEYVQAAVRNVQEHLDDKGGRPSLSGAAAKSPQITFRVREEIKAAVEARAIREGTTVSALARDALERYIAS